MSDLVNIEDANSLKKMGPASQHAGRAPEVCARRQQHWFALWDDLPDLVAKANAPS